MEKKFLQSYSKRESALALKIKSRGVTLWFNNRLSNISSKERVWLIIFTKSLDSDSEWYTKFWIWDSETNTIIGENVFHGYSNPTKDNNPHMMTMPFNTFGECYIDRAYQRVVMRVLYGKTYFIFDWKGNLLFQTNPNTAFLSPKIDKDGCSMFLSSNLFLCRFGDKLRVYDLSRTKWIRPKEINFLGSSQMLLSPWGNKKEKNLFYYPETFEYFIAFSWEESIEGGGSRDAMYVYVIDKHTPHESDETTYMKYVSKTIFQESVKNPSVEKWETGGLKISFFLEGNPNKNEMLIHL